MRVISFGILLTILSNTVNTQLPSPTQNINVGGVDITYVYSASTASTDYTVKFTLPAGLSSNNVWLGLGFNTQPAMDGASVVVCKAYPGSSPSVEHNVNIGYQSVLLDTNAPSLGLSNQAVTFANGNEMTCTFKRENANPSGGISRYFDTSASSPYLLVAYGNVDASSGMINYHSFRSASAAVVQQNPGQVIAPTTTTPAPESIDGFANGVYISGGTGLRWKHTKDSTRITLVSTVSSASDVYAAVGFSNDQKMGDDGVVYCTYASGATGGVSLELSQVVQGYNFARAAPRALDTANKAVGLTDMQVKVEDGQMTCSFTRAVTVPGVDNYFNLNNPYYLIFARGPVDGGSIRFHDSNAFASTDKIDFRTNTTITDVKTFREMKAHGTLMTIAWMFFASTGIVFARYYKFIFPSIKWFHLQFWFNVHRPLMVSVPMLSIVAFILILADNDWKWVDSINKTNYVHSIFGSIAIILSILQIPIALTRPAPTAPRRLIFNNVHRAIGLLSFLFATITLFLGVFIERVNVQTGGGVIMVLWVLWVILLPALIQVFEYLSVRKAKKNRPETYRVSSTGGSHDEAQAPQNEDDPKVARKKLERIKQLLLVAHLVISLTLTIVLAILICTAEDEESLALEF